MFGIGSNVPTYNAAGMSPGQVVGGAENILKTGVESVFANKQVAMGIDKMIGRTPAAAQGLGRLGTGIGGVGDIAEGLGKGALFGAAGEGIFSAITNGIKVFKKQETASQAGGAIAADSASGGVAALASAGASGLALAFLPAGGLFTLVGGAVGLGVFFLADKFFKSSPLYQSIKTKVQNFIQNTLHI